MSQASICALIMVGAYTTAVTVKMSVYDAMEVSSNVMVSDNYFCVVLLRSLMMIRYFHFSHFTFFKVSSFSIYYLKVCLVKTLLVISLSIYCFHRSYTMVHMLRFTIFVPFSARVHNENINMYVVFKFHLKT